jgi:hypothetical protein
MKIFYSCDSCGEPIDCLEVDRLDEEKFGFDRLTADERQDIIRYDATADVLYVQSLCDSCIEALGLADDKPAWAAKSYVQ